MAKEIMDLAVSHHHSISLVLRDNKYLIKKKVLDKSFIQSKIEQLMWEGNTLKKLNHKNLVKGIDYIRTENEAYILLEVIKGQSLYYNLKTKCYDLNSIVNMLIELLEVTEYLHSNDILHNDINPSNILIENGHIKLFDLSISQINGSDIHKLASPEFSSPEQINGLPSSEKTDVWGIGCVFFYMICSRRPFIYRKNSKFEQLYKNITLNDIERKIPMELSNLMLSMMERSPDKRPEIRQCINILHSILEKK